MFLCTPKRDLSSFVCQSDRDFFSVPVQVIPQYCDISTRLVYCQSPLQGGVTYPVDPKHLRSEHRLTNRERDNARTI